MKIKNFNKIYHRTLFLVIFAFTMSVLLFLFLIFLLARTSLFKTQIISENTGLIVVASVLSLIIVSQVITIYWNFRVNRPVEILSKAINRIAQGDFDVQIDPSGFKSEMKVLAKDFNKMIMELKSIEVMRTDFVSNVSHEFRAPLSTIQGYVTLISNPSLSQEQRTTYFQKLSESVRQITCLVDNVLQLSKFESQNVVSSTKDFRLDEQLRRTVLMFEDEWQKKNISFEIELPECIYCGNEEMINQIWTNIIGNAVKFSKENGTVKISIDNDENDYITVSISDSGIGMSEEVQRHVFEKFYQGDNSHKSKGNGLGLAIVKSVADLSGAKIEVESEPDKGSAFTVKLPRCNY